MINIAKLLKDAPKGMKLYSPLLGEVEFAEVMDTDYVPIRVMCGIIGERFDKFGRYKGNEYPDAECLLFPSKEVRTWEGWKLPVEPKFKVGNWYLCVKDFYGKGVRFDKGNTYHCGKDGCLQQFDYGAHISIVEELYEYFRLWTIADAKDGDVLALNGKPFIYSSHKYGKNYCYIDDCGQFRASFNLVFQGNCVCPATKEQRNFLFAKMRESGYEWNEKNKELRKIQPHYDIKNFHVGMPVLVRDYDNSRWSYVQFSHYVGEECGFKFNACGIPYIQCIPFNDDTKHLLGTTDMCPEEYINW